MNLKINFILPFTVARMLLPTMQFLHGSATFGIQWIFFIIMWFKLESMSKVGMHLFNY